MAATGRTGRRPGESGTRTAILAAARDLFAHRGFAATSIRAVAAAAGVDAALVHHYFGTKNGLFRAVLELPIDPESVIGPILAVGADEAPGALVRAFLQVWDGPETGPAMVGFLRRTLAEPGTEDLMRDFLGATVLRHLADRLLTGLDPIEAAARVGLVLSQLLGIAIARRVLRIEPIAGMPAEDLAAALTPTIARYLRGEIPSLSGTLTTSVAHPDAGGRSRS